MLQIVSPEMRTPHGVFSRPRAVWYKLNVSAVFVGTTRLTSLCANGAIFLVAIEAKPRGRNGVHLSRRQIRITFCLWKSITLCLFILNYTSEVVFSPLLGSIFV